MNELVDTMFEGIVIYIWYHPLDDDDDDFGAILIRSDDIYKAKEFSECGDGPHETSFYEFCRQLRGADISFYDISYNVDMYVYTE
jgi:hypothetical protein